MPAVSVQVIQMFPPTVLTTSAATLYTNTAGSPTTILARARVRFTNTSASPVTVTAYDVPSGGTAGTGNQFCPGLTILGNSSLDLDIPVLAYVGFLQALASVGSVVVAHSLDGILFT